VASKRDAQQIQQVAEAVTGLILEAIRATIEQRSPEPARECIGELISVDRAAVPDEGGGPAELMATLSLVRWATLVRVGVGEQPDWIAAALAWVEQTLGPRYRARSRYTSGALRSEEEAAEVMMYRESLRGDFLPSLLWLIAGVVAVYGDGDVDWLRALERGAPEHVP
jgi:hypothetical protein